MANLTIFPDEKTIEIKEGQNLLEALREQDFYIKSSCGGHASCSDCVVKIRSGIDNLCEPPFDEIQLLGNVFHITKERLACQCTIKGEVSIDISSHDKNKVEGRLRQKSFKKKPQTKVRKKEAIDDIMKERQDAYEAKQEKQNEWSKHWEREKDPSRPKRLGGGRRPKLFNTNEEDEMHIQSRTNEFISDETKKNELKKQCAIKEKATEKKEDGPAPKNKDFQKKR